MKDEWRFNSNVELIPSGKLIYVRNQEQSSIIEKIGYFLDFTLKLFLLIKKHKPKVVLLYDSMPLFSYFLIRSFIRRKPLLWYHNHDVIEMGKSPKLSIGWLAGFFEPKMFPHLDIFSLPAEERKIYFPMNKFKGRYFYIPNLPLKSFYKQFYTSEQKRKQKITLLYQGMIGENHGFEEIIELLDPQISKMSLSLTLVGPVNEIYKKRLIDLAKKYGVTDHLHWIPWIHYGELPRTTMKYHIGLAIHNVKNIQYSTGGTASNKIYEYAACGLPVLYFDNEHYTKHLSKYKWAVATDLTKQSLISSLELIDSNYIELSMDARSDFEDELNFEKHFEKIIDNLKFI